MKNDFIERCNKAVLAEKKVQAIIFKSARTPYDYQGIKDSVSGLGFVGKQRLKKRLQELVAAQKEITLPPSYFHFLNNVHKRAFGAFTQHSIVQKSMESWKRTDLFDPKTRHLRDSLVEDVNGSCVLTEAGRQTLDKAGLTYKNSLDCLDLASSALHKAWHDKLEIEVTTKPMVAEALPEDDKTPQLQGHYSPNKEKPVFWTGKWTSMHAVLPSLWSFGFHEPEHYCQSLIPDVIDQVSPEDKEFLSEAKVAFTKITSAYDSSILRVAADKEISNLSYQAYLYRPREVTAFYIDNLTKLALAREFGLSTQRSTKEWFVEHRPLQEHLPKELRRVLAM